MVNELPAEVSEDGVLAGVIGEEATESAFNEMFGDEDPDGVLGEDLSAGDPERLSLEIKVPDREPEDNSCGGDDWGRGGASGAFLLLDFSW